MVALPLVVCQNRVLQELNFASRGTYTLMEKIVCKWKFCRIYFCNTKPQKHSFEKRIFWELSSFCTFFWKIIGFFIRVRISFCSKINCAIICSPKRFFSKGCSLNKKEKSWTQNFLKNFGIKFLKIDIFTTLKIN